LGTESGPNHRSIAATTAPTMMFRPTNSTPPLPVSAEGIVACQG
jgi:hypothetical protein